MPASAGPGWVQIGRIPPAGIVPPSAGMRIEKVYGRGGPRPSRVVRSHPRVCLSLLVSPNARRLCPIQNFGGDLCLGQEETVTEHNHREHVVVVHILQHAVIHGPNHAYGREFGG